MVIYSMANFNSYIDELDMDFWRNLCVSKGKLCQYKKGEYFIKYGEPKYIWGFIERGYFKYMLVNSDGNEHITGLAFNNTPVGDYLSLVKGCPTVTDIVAATDAAVWVCDREVVEKLFDAAPKLHHIVADALLSQTYERFLSLYSQSPKERYLNLLKHCPDILQDITLKELASYLQVTPTHLSRIRKEITFAQK
ncbi:Crp/Fnr family transcriptional regulator [uncultured Bacteroides sp.]|uniref:Crp/Fnr family transcriptional regulator n=1 Tax=uncultured Bacteroides sp. TaxID=162156 RepID=UPI0025F90657|nr:Crp/Fnr family transcriptional regulator [uncultured Bacteroides sp.]